MKLFVALVVGGLGALFALDRVMEINECGRRLCVTPTSEILGLLAALLLFAAFVRAWTLIARTGSWRAIGAAVAFVVGIGLMVFSTILGGGRSCTFGCGLYGIVPLTLFAGAVTSVLALLYALWFRWRRTRSG